MKKILIVVLDGVADEPDDVLFGETPLSFVHTPRPCLR